MKTISQLLKKLRESYGDSLQVHYIHPLLYIAVVQDAFRGLNSDARSERLRDDTGIRESDLTALTSRGIIQMILITHEELQNEYSFLNSQDRGQHWLAWYTSSITRKAPSPISAETAPSKAIHFYGFKGGQARSTVLVLLAKSLADSGARVLIVDADVEAPSLDTFFDVVTDDPASTLMGLCGWADQITPVPRVYVGRPNPGTIDLLSCRPRSSEYDIDFAGFLLNTAVDARVLQDAATKIHGYASGKSSSGDPRYNFALFDHRTGLAPSVLPIMEGWPGPAVVFVRPDGMSRHLERSPELNALLSYDRETPGAFVSFSLDPKETTEIAQATHGKFIERLLESLSDALTRSVASDIDPTELDRYWILWHHDLALITKSAPAPTELSALNQTALAQIQEVLGLKIDYTPPPRTEDVTLSKSGATDQGIFILTPDVERLFSLDSKFLYIFGRKGTGKTRLLRELYLKKLGEPLLVARDFDDSGIQSGGPTFNELLRASNSDFEIFWWSLLHAALLNVGSDKDSLTRRVSEVASLSRKDFYAFSSPKAVESELQTPSLLNTRRVFLIDGVETAVPAAKLREFVESLFRFLATAQYSRAISNALSIRLFLRSDLYKSAAQNVEQQIEGSVMNLRWDRTSILNFAVARMGSLEWFRSVFPRVVERIDGEVSRIAKGALSDSEAEDILLEVFPQGLERNKIKTTTFFTSYFSDAGGENEARASFYPRLFDGFLREMNDTARSTANERLALKAGRLNSPFVLRAYDAASGVFIDEVRTELYNLLDLISDESQNREAVDRFIDAFSGLSTPFLAESTIAELATRTLLQTERIREAINRMKQLGIFEDRPGYPGWWRTGRLYKSGLKMKYVRT